MSTPDTPTEDDQPQRLDAPGEDLGPEEYGSLSIEDDPEGTVDPGELAGGASEDDADVS